MMAVVMQEIQAGGAYKEEGRDLGARVEYKEWSTSMASWVLWNLETIREMYDRNMEPSVIAKYVSIPVTVTSKGGSCKVVKMAIERAAVSSVLGAVEHAIRLLHPEQRKIYRMKWRVGITNKEIQKRMHISRSTLDRRILEIKEAVARELILLPDEVLDEFWKQIDKWNQE